VLHQPFWSWRRDSHTSPPLFASSITVSTAKMQSDTYDSTNADLDVATELQTGSGRRDASAFPGLPAESLTLGKSRTSPGLGRTPSTPHQLEALEALQA
jgi:hypothetical protein